MSTLVQWTGLFSYSPQDVTAWFNTCVVPVSPNGDIALGLLMPFALVLLLALTSLTHRALAKLLLCCSRSSCCGGRDAIDAPVDGGGGERKRELAS